MSKTPVHRGVRVTAALAAALWLSGCRDAPTAPAVTGSIAPRLALVRADSATRASLVLPLTAVRAQVIGPVSRVVDLQLRGSAWEGRATGLRAGTYEVVVEGLANGEVQYYGRVASVSLSRGATAEPFIAFAPSVPTLAAPPLATTTNFVQRITFARIAAASWYTIQASPSPAFDAGVVESTVTDTAPLVTVTDRGAWYVRSRAVLPQTASPVPWAEARSWVVETATGGASAAEALPVPSALAAVQTMGGRNLTTDKRSDWFSVSGVRSGDSIIVETYAARLAQPSPLNTIVTAYRADAVTEVASNGDASGTTDSRIVFVATVSEPHLVRVTADASGNGHYELRVSQRRLPAAPTALVASLLSPSSALLQWTDAADNETGFRIERCAGSDCTLFAELDSAAADATSITDSTLTPGGTFRWRVRARNEVGHSPYSNIVGLASTTPDAPSELTTTVLDGNVIRLDWTDNATNESAVLIERCTGDACTDFAQVAMRTGAGLVTFDDSTAAADQWYRYRIRASNAVGPSGYSNIASAITAPAAPSGLTATTLSATVIALAWTDASTTETQFVIERCAGDGCTDFAAVATVATDVTSRSDTVAADQAYTYRVRALSAAGSSAPSGTATAHTRVPAAPADFQGSVVSATSLALTWTDAATDETGYRLERCEGVNCANTPSNFVVTDNLAANSTGITVTGLVTGTRYSFRLAAINVAGASPTVIVANLRPQ